MIESHQDELFVESKRSVAPMALAAISALIITGLVFTGYALLRKRHAEESGSLALSSTPTAEARKPPKALIVIDEALLQGGKTTIAGTVKNTSAEKLDGLSVELELKRRKDGVTEAQLLPLNPPQLEPEQEGRYSLQLKAQDYSSAKLIGLKAGPGLVPLAYTTAQGQKRPLERLETKTITVGKGSKKGGEFLNSPDKPARVP
jgi:hypothetical protein